MQILRLLENICKSLQGMKLIHNLVEGQELFATNIQVLQLVQPLLVSSNQPGQQMYLEPNSFGWSLVAPLYQNQ
jgi:hypothetical protein